MEKDGDQEPEKKAETKDPLKVALDFARMQYDTYSMMAEDSGPHKIKDVSSSKAKLQDRITSIEKQIAQRDVENIPVPKAPTEALKEQ
jgi:hypothetical protein